MTLVPGPQTRSSERNRMDRCWSARQSIGIVADDLPDRILATREPVPPATTSARCSVTAIELLTCVPALHVRSRGLSDWGLQLRRNAWTW